MKVGDRVRVVNPERAHFGLAGKIVSQSLLDFGVAVHDDDGRHVGGGVFEPNELVLIEDDTHA